MRRILAVLALMSLLASYLAFTALPASAADQVCWTSQFIYRNDTAMPGDVTVTLRDSPLTASYSETFTLQPGEQKTAAVYGLFSSTAGGFSSTAQSLSLTFVGFGDFGEVPLSNCITETPSSPIGSINDGRINAYDLGAPLAAYCTADHGMEVWDIDAAGNGALAFTVTQDQIVSGLNDASASGQNTLVGQGLGDSLYATIEGQLILFGPDLREPGKVYQFATTGARCG